ncbi:MAG: hypothetical protein WBO29_08540 [Albidovulum sp.]
MKLPGSELRTAQYIGAGLVSLVGAIFGRLFPEWPWLFIGGGILASIFALSVDGVGLEDGKRKDTLIPLLTIGPAIYLCGLFLATLGIGLFDVVLTLLGWGTKH